MLRKSYATSTLEIGENLEFAEEILMITTKKYLKRHETTINKLNVDYITSESESHDIYRLLVGVCFVEESWT